MERYTRKNAEAAFERLAQKLGKPTAKSTGKATWRRVGDRNVATVGQWALDHNSIYGGFVVVEIVNEGGGEAHPLGDRRMPAREFCQSIYFAERVLSLVDSHELSTLSLAEIRNGTGFERNARFAQVS
jgi:hypothetical protein